MLVDAIHPQLDVLFIIDNGDGDTLPKGLWQSGIKIICLGENYGIAYAQNVGVREALSCGGEFILLLDQDSVPAANMLSCLRVGPSTFRNRQSRLYGASFSVAGKHLG